MISNKPIRIIVPICILAVIVGIWVYKNLTDRSEVKGTGRDDSVFALDAETIDLEELKSHNLPMIIDFGADSCEPCKLMAPVLVKLNQDMRGKAIIKFVDVWKHSDAANDFPIQLIPSQVFYNADGTPYVPGDHINLEFIIYNTRDSGEHAYTVHQGMLTEEQMLLILSDMGVEP